MSLGKFKARPKPLFVEMVIATRALYANPAYGPGYVARVWDGDHVPALRDGALHLVYVECEVSLIRQRVWWREDAPWFGRAEIRRKVRVDYDALPFGHAPADVAFMFGEY
jgi:hypothetical protein